MKRVWNEHLDNILRRNYPKGDLDALAQRMGMTIGAIKCRACVLGLKRKVHKREPWTDRQLAYLRKRVNPHSDILIMTQNKDVSVYTAKRLSTPDTATYAATGHRPENIRGLTYDTALLFDIQDYGVCSPAREDNDFRRVATAVFPVISSNPNSLLILHARADVPHLYRWPGLKEYTDPSLAPPDVPIKKPDPTVPIIIPLKLKNPESLWNKGFSPCNEAIANRLLPPHPRPL